VELKHFLENINQIKYFDAFKENCFDDLSSILEIKENHLNVLGINEEDQECFLRKNKRIKRKQRKVIYWSKEESSF